jgi:hypothetical protein
MNLNTKALDIKVIHKFLPPLFDAQFGPHIGFHAQFFP